MGRLLFIGDAGAEQSEGGEEEESFSLVWIDATHPTNFLGFGDERANNSRNSYLLKEPATQKYKTCRICSIPERVSRLTKTSY